MRYKVGCYESGDLIENCATHGEALETITNYEKDDRESGVYEEGFYGILDSETEEWEQIK